MNGVFADGDRVSWKTNCGTMTGVIVDEGETGLVVYTSSGHSFRIEDLSGSASFKVIGRSNKNITYNERLNH